MGTQISVSTGTHAPVPGGRARAVLCAPAPAGWRSFGRRFEPLSGGVAVGVRRRSDCAAAGEYDGSNGGSNEPGVRVRAARSGGAAAPQRPRLRRRRRGDGRRPRSGHLSGSSRRVLAPPVDCPRGEIRLRPWERWARLSVTLTVVTLLGFGVHAAMSSAPTGVLVEVTVQRGDTLWGLAQEFSPDRDPRAVVEEIEVVNDLPEGVLPVGLVIQVPSSSPVQEAAPALGSPSVTAG